MGIVTKSIGTSSRDYSTVQAWEDALPANLVTDTNSQVGECYNDSEFDENIIISGETTSALYTITLTTASGESFRDDANVQSNALKYNQSNGVAIKCTNGYGTTLQVGAVNYCTVSNLQLKATAGSGVALDTTLAQGTCNYKYLIVEGSGYGSYLCRGTFTSSLFVQRGSGKTNIVYVYYGGIFNNCTFACPTGIAVKPTYAFSGYSSPSPIFTNCAFFGSNVFTDGGGSAGIYLTCYTDATSPPVGFVTATYDNNLFVDTTDDWRLLTGSALLDVGTTYFDIVGTARPQNSLADVGAWELVVSSPAPSSGGGGEGKSNYMRG